MAVQTQDDDEWSLVSATTLFTALPPDAFVVISEFLEKADRTSIRATCSTVWNGLSFHFKLRFPHWEDVARFVRQQHKMKKLSQRTEFPLVSLIGKMWRDLFKMKKLSTKDDIEPLAPRQCSELSIGQALFSRKNYKGKDAARLAELLKVACCSAVQMDGTTECTLQKLTLPWDDSLVELSSCLSKLQTKNLYSLTLGSSDKRGPSKGFFDKAWCQNLTKLSFFASNVSFFPLPRTLRVVELGFGFANYQTMGTFTDYLLQRESLTHLEEVWYTQNRESKPTDPPCYSNFLHATRPKVDGRMFQVKMSIADVRFTLKHFKETILPLLAGATWILLRGDWDTWLSEAENEDDDKDDVIMSLVPSLESATRVVRGRHWGHWCAGTSGKIPLNVLELRVDFQTEPFPRRLREEDSLLHQVLDAPESLQRLYLSFAHPSCKGYRWDNPTWLMDGRARLKMLSELVIELPEVTQSDLADIYNSVWSAWNTHGSVLKVVVFVARRPSPAEQELLNTWPQDHPEGWDTHFIVVFGRLPVKP